jgi:hypothetical protein
LIEKWATWATGHPPAVARQCETTALAVLR